MPFIKRDESGTITGWCSTDNGNEKVATDYPELVAAMKERADRRAAEDAAMKARSDYFDGLWKAEKTALK